MTKLLRFTLLFVFVFTTNHIFSQEDLLKERNSTFTTHSTDLNEFVLVPFTNFSQKEVFSYKECGGVHSHGHHEHHEGDLHLNSFTLIDIISSDEGADFNCSGGFCMDESHFHKRGLTLKKQLFDYFMSISC
ncbi:hypothetical protein [uncultured Aquimarina sp.]|uniref:hypothetical protein n=1 Tax=uncultured Aquimarina sp. TaxID=575652 RepID=UPI00260E6176|nr:hypothetical protein [uncultured Aquimarina sp.]